MANKSAKQKPVACASRSKLLSANVSNLTVEVPSASGCKGKSPTVATRGVNIQPDLDLIGGFAFLSFSSLEHLETHIEQNEGKYRAVSVNVGQKRKAEDGVKLEGSSSESRCPLNKKKVNVGKKAAVVKRNSSDFSTTPKSEKTPISKNAATIGQKTQAGKTEISRRGKNTTLQDSPNRDSEISLLCSETVDLEDEEDFGEQEACRKPRNAVSQRVYDSAENEFSVFSSTVLNDDIEVESRAMDGDPRPKKKKKKRQRSELCDQTSQTKFKIKKKKKSASKGQELCNAGRTENVSPLELISQGVDGNVSGKASVANDDKSELSLLKFEALTCARTSTYLAASKSNNYYQKGRISGLGFMSAPAEQGPLKTLDKTSLDVFTPNSSDREVDVGDETRSVSVLSDFSDHSSDIETFDAHRCFLLNNKIVKVERENYQEGDDDLEVDVETVSKDVNKNFLVVSGIEIGHFSYHPDVTSEGTIDTSIQVLPNEIDIFLHCAKMQEGQIIKIINPDDCLELQSHVNQKRGRDVADIKATRSATERRRRHRLGDLFRDMKQEVFTDGYESDLYFSKQAILSKAISTLEELSTKLNDLTKNKALLLKQNKKLREKRNNLLFGKSSGDVDDDKVASILKSLNITVDKIHEECKNEIAGQEIEGNSMKKEACESNVAVVEPSVKGRPKANKCLIPHWLLIPAVRKKVDPSLSRAHVTDRLPGESKDNQTSDSSKETSSPKNVSCGVQTQSVDGMSKLPELQSSDVLAESVAEGNRQPSSAEGSPKVIHTVTCMSSEQVAVTGKVKTTDSSKPGLKSSSPTQSLLTKEQRKQTASGDTQPDQEEVKPSLLKILPKPAILHLNPSQQKAFVESLGQIKQPSSDKIICNLSRLSTQSNPNAPSRICIIRSGQVMKSLDSKNVMHIQIANDALKSLGTSGSSAVSGDSITATSWSSQATSGGHSVGIVQNISATPLTTVAADKGTVMTSLTSQGLSVSRIQNAVRLVPASQPPPVIAVQKPLVFTSTNQIPLVGTVQKIASSTKQIFPVTAHEKPIVLSSAAFTVPQKFVVCTSTPQIFSTVAGARQQGPPSVIAQGPDKHPKKTITLLQNTLGRSTDTTQSLHERPQMAMTSLSQETQNQSQVSVDMTQQALAMLNKLHTNNTASNLTNPLATSESPGSGSLIGLRNIVMKVGSKEHFSTSVKANTTSQISIASGSQPGFTPCAVADTSSTTFGLPNISLPCSFSPSISLPSSTLFDKSTPSMPPISVPTSTSLNNSFTVSAASEAINPHGTNVSANIDPAVQQLIGPCPDPFGFLTEELALPSATVSSKPSPSSCNFGREKKNLQRQFPDSGRTMSPSFGVNDNLQPEITKTSTVLTQEMLKIAGINQSPELSPPLNPPDLNPLIDVFSDLAEMDGFNSTVSVTAADSSCCATRGTTEGAARADPVNLQTNTLRSFSLDVNKVSSPSKVAPMESKKGKVNKVIYKGFSPIQIIQSNLLFFVCIKISPCTSFLIWK